MIYVEAGMNPEGTQQCYYRKIEDILLAHGYRLFRIYEQKAEWMQDSPLLRRVNMAFMSQRFVDANPMRLSRELFQAQRDLTRMQGDLSKAQDELSRARDELAKAQDEFSKARHELTRSRDELSKAQHESSKVQDELSKARRELSKAQEEQARADAALVRVRAELGKSQAKLAQSEQTDVELRRQLAEALNSSAASERARAALANQVSTLNAQHAQLSKAESYVPLVMRSIGETHQRVLAAQADAERAHRDLDKIKRSRTYRAVRAVAANRRSLGGWFAMLPALWSARRREPAQRSGDRRLLAMGFSGEQAALTVPLTSRQGVLLPASPKPYDVVVKLYSPAADGPPVPVRLNLGSRQLDAQTTLEVMDGTTGTALALTPGAEMDVELPVWTTVHLIRVPASEEPFVVAIRGPSARQCSLKLWLRSRTDASASLRGQPRSAAPAQARPATEAAKASAEDAADGITSEELDAKLWGGYASHALAALEQRKLNVTVAPQEREAAAWSLARWYYVEGQLERALEQVEFTRSIVKRPQRRIALLEAQCLVELGRYKDADASLARSLTAWPEIGRMLKLYRSTVARHLALERGLPVLKADEVQLEHLNELFTKAGLAPLEKRDPDQPLSLGNLVVRAKTRLTDQNRKVSVVIPCFNAESSIEWVIGGLQQQTWKNLEIIVVDDLSTDRSADVVAAIAARDSRVRLVRQAKNGGAYTARNAGARLATGHYITVHDSDDWSHPEKIEREIELLDASPGKIGVITHWVRVGEQLDIVGPWVPRGSLFDVNFSSLLFERKLLEEIGYWDEVRVSGDAEFYYRLRWVFGEDSIAKIPSRYILSLSLARDDSLTRSKATHLRSLFYGLRRNYREAYLSWSSNPVPDTDTRVVDPETGRRKFPMPIGCRHGSDKDPAYDLIVIADFAEEAEADIALAALAAAQRKGQRAAAFHWRKYERSATASAVPHFHRHCVEMGFDILSPGDAAHAGSVLVFEPSILDHKIDPTPHWQAKGVDLVVLQASPPGHDPRLAHQHARDVFEVEASWIGATDEVRAEMQRDTRYPPVSERTWRQRVGGEFGAHAAGSAPPHAAGAASSAGKIGEIDLLPKAASAARV